MSAGPPRLRPVPPLDATDEAAPGEGPEGSGALPPRAGSSAEAVARVALLLAVSAVAALLIGPKLVGVELPTTDDYLARPGRVHVRADRDYALVDDEATGARREQAALEARSVWDLDLARAQADARILRASLARLDDALEPLRAAARKAQPAEDPAVAPPPPFPRDALVVLEAERARLAGDLAGIGAEAPRDDAWRALVTALWRSPAARDALTSALEDGLSAPVVGDRALLDRDETRGVVVRAVPASLGQGERVIERLATILNLREARATMAAQLSLALEGPPLLLSAGAARVLSAWASGLLRTTLTYNASESDIRRRAAAAAVPAATVRVYRGEMVLRPGEIITRRHLLVLRAMEQQQGEQMRTRAALGSGAFVLLLCLVVYHFGLRGVFGRSLPLRDLVVLGALLHLSLLCGLLADRLIAPVNELLPDVPALALVCAVPLAFGAMQVRVLISSEAALLFALLAALLGGVMAEPGTTWTIVAMLSSLVGVALAGRARRRTGLVGAGLVAGIVAAAGAVTLELFRGALPEDQLFWLIAGPVAGGFLSGLLTLALTPMAEAALGYVTDLRLAALADLNQPLLKELIVHAPGTWHHSMRVAHLAGAAARAIDANERLARVIALYHDVGKIKQPQFFVESLHGRDNPHARLEPEASAKILHEQVSKGVELARRARLPREVVEAISEHHADLPMAHSVDEARAAAASKGAPFRTAAALRHRGPRPRSRESALVLLADQVEAAGRGREEGGKEARAAAVLDIFERALGEGALSSSSLTFHQLSVVREVLLTTLDALEEGQGGGAEITDPRARLPS